ncbi:hypothetical protein KPATCC21470_0222 [Kitasatospora purpeofusca]
MRDLISARVWLTVFVPPAYTPEPNAVEYLWAHIKHSLAKLASVALDRLTTLVRDRLERLQYRPDVLDDFLAGTVLQGLQPVVVAVVRAAGVGRP